MKHHGTYLEWPKKQIIRGVGSDEGHSKPFLEAKALWLGSRGTATLGAFGSALGAVGFAADFNVRLHISRANRPHRQSPS